MYLLAGVIESRDDIPQATFLGAESGFSPYLPGARDATSIKCAAEQACKWAVEADTATVMMFAEKDDAIKAAEAFGADAQRSGWIVVDFTSDGLTSTQRDELMQGVDGLHTSG